MAGTMVIRWMLERFKLATGSPFNKVMVGYNAGPNRSILTQNKYVDTLALTISSAVPNESKAYLKKMLGVDGFLSLIYKDKVING